MVRFEVIGLSGYYSAARPRSARSPVLVMECRPDDRATFGYCVRAEAGGHLSEITARGSCSLRPNEGALGRPEEASAWEAGRGA